MLDSNYMANIFAFETSISSFWGHEVRVSGSISIDLVNKECEWASTCRGHTIDYIWFCGGLNFEGFWVIPMAVLVIIKFVVISDQAELLIPSPVVIITCEVKVETSMLEEKTLISPKTWSEERCCFDLSYLEVFLCYSFSSPYCVKDNIFIDLSPTSFNKLFVEPWISICGCCTFTSNCVSSNKLESERIMGRRVCRCTILVILSQSEVSISKNHLCWLRIPSSGSLWTTFSWINLSLV